MRILLFFLFPQVEHPGYFTSIHPTPRLSCSACHHFTLLFSLPPLSRTPTRISISVLLLELDCRPFGRRGHFPTRLAGITADAQYKFTRSPLTSFVRFKTTTPSIFGSRKQPSPNGTTSQSQHSFKANGTTTVSLRGRKAFHIQQAHISNFRLCPASLTISSSPGAARNSVQ